MSEKAVPRVRQFDAELAALVEALAGGLPDTRPERLVQALCCAAVAVHAQPPVARRLASRLQLLLADELTPQDIGAVLRTVRRAREMTYTEGQETHLTVREAARRLGVARSTVYRWLDTPGLNLSWEHDDPRIAQRRITIGTFQRMKTLRHEWSEADDLRSELLGSIARYEAERIELLHQRLTAAGGLLTVEAVCEHAGRERISVSKATVRRWPAIDIDRTFRGRPRRVYDASEVAKRLAALDCKNYERMIRAESTPVQTLRRLKKERRLA